MRRGRGSNRMLAAPQVLPVSYDPNYLAVGYRNHIFGNLRNISERPAETPIRTLSLSVKYIRRLL